MRRPPRARLRLFPHVKCFRESERSASPARGTTPLQYRPIPLPGQWQSSLERRFQLIRPKDAAASPTASWGLDSAKTPPSPRLVHLHELIAAALLAGFDDRSAELFDLRIRRRNDASLGVHRSQAIDAEFGALLDEDERPIPFGKGGPEHRAREPPFQSGLSRRCEVTTARLPTCSTTAAARSPRPSNSSTWSPTRGSADVREVMGFSLCQRAAVAGVGKVGCVVTVGHSTSGVRWFSERLWL